MDDLLDLLKVIKLGRMELKFDLVLDSIDSVSPIHYKEIR